MQWFVLFDVVHPGQHCPPQTFLLWSHQSKVNTRILGGGTICTAPFGQGLGEYLKAGKTCPHSTGRSPGRGTNTMV